MLDDNLINSLEETLRQARQLRQQMVMRLRNAQNAVSKMKAELGALDQSINQTRLALGSLRNASHQDINSWDDESFSYDEMIELNGGLDDLDLVDDVIDDFSSRRPSRTRRPPVSIIRRGEGGKNRRGGVEQVHNRFADRTITQACTLLLREHGGPLHVNELYDLLVEGGMQFTGNNPTISIAVSLNRNRRFNKVSPGTFDLMIKDASQAAS
jgi:HAMP domain-containing protein